MSRALWLRFLGASVFFALVLSALDLFLAKEVAGSASDDVQHSVYLFVARIVEEQPYAQSVRRVASLGAESPAMPLQLWVVSASGQVIAASAAYDPPARLRALARPAQVHEIVSYGRFFSGGPAGAVVRLNAPAPTYLLVHNPGVPGRHTFRTLGLLFIATVAGAILLGLALVLLYLRGRSAQARQVIAQMESGNLSARFAGDRLDAIGHLMTDFNRMADEIERLVTRLQTTESARRELLQELGHDLRTPLTSLRTAIETLTVHGEAMSPAERAEFFKVVNGELEYFGKLIDDLFFIADIDEPRYRKMAERIDIEALVAAEIQAAQGKAGARGIRFELDCGPARPMVSGDAYLIARLFRNVFDNATRFATSRVRVAIRVHSGAVAGVVEIAVEDDGPGMAPEAIAAFGQRRSRRVPAGAGQPHVSLGLGSVIIKAIAALHDGQLQIESHATDAAIAGTRLTITLPCASCE
ncbi:HAMP domain-containing sensor histidine kinase [Noviherbaspirillum autotrophicum]|uniref:HAMP domain-containing sensor histidine kinase n=1 Tax=Noviherbaspirillum autotrophicum TaxID=709839 RepID=UPI000694093D|nr:HAMP domain-containing sensor histidine kinase [Noviherbaspirillum autotrophicum]